MNAEGDFKDDKCSKKWIQAGIVWWIIRIFFAQKLFNPWKVSLPFWFVVLVTESVFIQSDGLGDAPQQKAIDRGCVRVESCRECDVRMDNTEVRRFIFVAILYS